MLIFSTATAPFSAVSTWKPYSRRISSAISRFSSLSSTSRMVRPLKSSCFSGRSSCAASVRFWPRALIRVSRRSERNMGLEQNAVTPAAFASTSMSDQS